MRFLRAFSMLLKWKISRPRYVGIMRVMTQLSLNLFKKHIDTHTRRRV